MQYSRLGETGLIVSRLAFGSMTFGSDPTGPFAATFKVDQAGANELVARAIDAGVNFFNSADVYAGGDSERILGKAIGAKRQQVVIATKVGNRMGTGLVETGLSRRHMHAAAEASLARLGTDYIDVYLVHKVDALTPIEETIGALEDLVRSGKVRYVGFSNWPAWLAAKAVGIQRARGYSQFRAAEMYYSLVGRDLEHEVAPFCADAGIGVMVWSPLAGGFLSGKYTRARPQGESGDRLGGFDFLPYDREKGYELIDLLQSIGAKRNASAAQVSLAWLLTRPSVASILVGASNRRQLDENLGAGDLQLAGEDLAALDAATKPPAIYPNWFNERVVDGKAYRALGLPLSVPPVR
jgi:aryl-alcohol dehydrogenase-like predicted oxidoreductase